MDQFMIDCARSEVLHHLYMTVRQKGGYSLLSTVASHYDFSLYKIVEYAAPNIRAALQHNVWQGYWVAIPCSENPLIVSGVGVKVSLKKYGMGFYRISERFLTLEWKLLSPWYAAPTPLELCLCMPDVGEELMISTWGSKEYLVNFLFTNGWRLYGWDDFVNGKSYARLYYSPLAFKSSEMPEELVTEWIPGICSIQCACRSVGLGDCLFVRQALSLLSKITAVVT